MDQVDKFNNYLDTYVDNPVDCWADHMERRDVALKATECRPTEEVKKPAPELVEAGDDVLELHPQDEPMDVTPAETGNGAGATCIWELADDLSNLPAAD